MKRRKLPLVLSTAAFALATSVAVSYYRSATEDKRGRLDVPPDLLEEVQETNGVLTYWIDADGLNQFKIVYPEK